MKSHLKTLSVLGLVLSTTLSGCMKQNSENNNFRASKGWFFWKEYASLLFVPYATLTNLPEPNGPRLCSYYLHGDQALPGKNEFMDLRQATEQSKIPFSINTLFNGMKQAAESDKNMKQIISNWAEGSASMAGDFLSNQKGKIEAVVAATAVTAAALTVACSTFMHVPPTICAKTIAGLGKVLNIQSANAAKNKLLSNKEFGALAKKIIENRKLHGATSFLAFIMGFLPDDWKTWLGSDVESVENAENIQMAELMSTLNSSAAQKRAELRLESILAKADKFPEEVNWKSLQTITAISMAAVREENIEANSVALSSSESTTASDATSAPAADPVCPLARNIDKKIVSDYFGITTGWAATEP